MVASIGDLIQAGRYVNIIAGIFFWVFGVTGSIFILIIFLSRPQLRRNPSSQYIILAAILDFIFLALALGYRIMTDGFAVQGALALFFYQPVVCRIRSYITGVTNFATLYTKCLCAFDQYAATSRSNKIRKFSSIKWARIFLTVSTSIWILMSVPQLLYNDIVTSSSGALSCVGTSISLTYAYTYFLLPVVYFFVPLVLFIFFGYFTYLHVTQLGQNSTNTSRFHRIERQITSLIIVQTLLCVITSLPYGAQYLYTGITLLQKKDSYRLLLEALIQHVVRLNLYASSAAPFYIYICFSSEIRHMALDLIRSRGINNNRVSTIQAVTQTNGATAIDAHKLRRITLAQTKPIEN